MLESAFAQPLQNWALRGLALAQQRIIDVAPLFSLRLQVCGLTQVGLIREHDEKFCLLTVSSVFHHPRRDLVRPQRIRSMAYWFGPQVSVVALRLYPAQTAQSSLPRNKAERRTKPGV